MMEFRVLGLWLSHDSWKNNRAMMLSFRTEPIPHWTGFTPPSLDWPKSDATPDPGELSAAILRFVSANAISAVAVSGPQGWRDPSARLSRRWLGWVTVGGRRPSICKGRLCEYKVRPRPEPTPSLSEAAGWSGLRRVAYSVAVFDSLLKSELAVLADDPDQRQHSQKCTLHNPGPRQRSNSAVSRECTCSLDSEWVETDSRRRVLLRSLPVGHFYVLESAPMQSLYRSRLTLPPRSHSSDVLDAFELTPFVARWTVGHSALLAITTALPAAGILGGPCLSNGRGEPSHMVDATDTAPRHRTEGLCWHAVPLGTYDAPEYSRIPTAAMKLNAMTLRGIGSYQYGQRLEIRPLTVICGENASGKSTWLKAFDGLWRSRRLVLPIVLPLSSDQDYYGPINANLKHWSESRDPKKELLYPESRDRDRYDYEYGLPKTVGFEFTTLRDLDLGYALGSHATDASPKGTLTHRFVWLGSVPKGTRFRMRVTLPQETETPGTCNLGGRLELSIEDELSLRMDTANFGPDSWWYVVSLPAGVLRGKGATGLLMKEVARWGHFEKDRGWETRPLEGGCLSEQEKSAVETCLLRIRQITALLSEGCFHIGAIRRTKDRCRVPFLRRDVGADGIRSHDVLITHQNCRMRQLVPPLFAGNVQASQISDRFYHDITFALCKAANSKENSPWLSIWLSLDAVAKDALKKDQQKYIDIRAKEGRVRGMILDLNTPLGTLAFWQNSEAKKVIDGLLGRSDLHKMSAFVAQSPSPELELLLCDHPLHPSDLFLRNLLLLSEAADLPTYAVFGSHSPFDLSDYVATWLDSLLAVRPQIGWRATFPVPGNPSAAAYMIGDIPPLGGASISPGISFSHPTCRHVSLEKLSSGYSQIAPIVIQTGVMKESEVLAIENPEVHLHPRLQSQLAEFLMQNARVGKRFLIETHGDLLVRRITRAVIEKEIKARDVALYFARLKHDKKRKITYSVLERIKFDKVGRIQNWPKGFLDQSVEESRKLLLAMDKAEAVGCRRKS